MTPDHEFPAAAAEPSAEDELEDFEPTDPETNDATGGGSAGKGGSIVVLDPTNATRP